MMGLDQKKVEPKKVTANRPPRPLDYDQSTSAGILENQRRLRREFYDRQEKEVPVYLDDE